MIHLDILSSPDPDAIGKYQFFQNEVYLGSTTGNLTIRDPELRASHFMIEVVDQELIVHPQKTVETYLIDGKRATSVHKIKLHQPLTIGGTVFKVIAFERSEIPSKKTILDQKLNQLLAQESPLLPVIEKLTKLMK